MISRQDVEKFLVHKYGTEIFRYKGFRYVRDIIASNDDYVTGSIYQEYNIVAAEYDTNAKTIESRINHFKNILSDDKVPNNVFINNLIFEFKEYKKGEL